MAAKDVIIPTYKPYAISAARFVDLCSVLFIASMIMAIAVLTNTGKLSLSLQSLPETVNDSFEPQRDSQHSTTAHFARAPDSRWWDKARANIQQHRYGFSLLDNKSSIDGEKVWLGNNSAHNMTMSFSRSGATIKSLNTPDQTKKPWQLNMHFIGSGSPGSSLQQANKVEPRIDTNKLTYVRGEITEWYVNTPRGIEQGFTLNTPLNQTNTAIEIRLGIDGYQQVNYNADGSIVFSVGDHDNVLNYGLPHAFDAEHNPLAVKMTLRDQQISLIVQTQDAVYPITIDPLIGTSTDNCSNPYLWCDGANYESSDYGWEVINAGDVNGDGYDDILITDPFYNYSSTTLAEQGEVYLFYGSASGLTHTIQWSKLGNVASSSFGLSAASGDINHDGYSDVIIGAPGDLSKVATAYTGQVFVYYGSSGGLSTTPAWTATSASHVERFGDAVASADVNGDGFDDVIIGAPGHTTIDAQQISYANAGAVYVYYATATGLPTTANWLVEAYQADTLLGDAVANAGNVNGDLNTVNTVDYPVEDVIFGAHHFDTTDNQNIVHPNAGRAIVYYGIASLGLPANAATSDFSVAPDWFQESLTDYMFYGKAVASAGNVNGDTTLSGVALDDIIIGAPAFLNSANSPTPPYPGKSYIFHGSANGLENTQAWTASGYNYALFGNAVSSAGDVNDDGYADIIVTESHYSLAGSPLGEEGRALLYDGTSAGLVTVESLIGTGVVHGDFFGWSAAHADVNNDGYADILIGAPGLRSYTPDPTLALGGVYLFEGAGNSDLSVSMTLLSSDVITNTAKFNVTITNNGPDIAHKIRISDAWPGMTYIASVTPPQWLCAVNLAGAQLNCPAPADLATNISLASGASAALTIDLQAASVSVISHTAEVTGKIIDPNLTNNTKTSAPINTPPQGADLAFTVTEDVTASNLAFNVSDPDPNAVISYVIVTPPSHGTISINKDLASGNDTGTFNYQPNPNNNLPDGFSFEAFDEKGASSGLLKVSITITAVNDAPTATLGLNFTADVGGTLVGNVTATDIEPPPNVLSFSIDTSAPLPTKGTVLMTNPGSGEFTYTANTTAIAGDTDQFTFMVTDSDPTNPLSDTATVAITITGVGTPVNLPPTVTANQQLNVIEDVLKSGQFLASDTTPATPVLTFKLDPSKLASKGVVTITNALTGAFNYQPNGNIFGQDNIGFIVIDNGTIPLSAAGAVAVTIAPVNDPPNALPVSLAVNQNSVFSDNATVPLKGSDIDVGDVLSYSIATGTDAPSKGSVNMANNGTAIVYQPNPGSMGIDTFKYIVTDNGSPPAIAMAVVTVTINASPTIEQPIPNPTVVEDGSVAITITASDIDSTNLSLNLISAAHSKQPVQNIPITTTPPTGGITTTTFTFTYTPVDNFNGTDAIKFTISDDMQPKPASITANIPVTITPQNDNPQALATPTATSPIIILEDSPAISFTLLASDIDLDPNLNLAGVSDALTFTIDDIDLVANADGTIDTNLGKVALNATTGSVTYTPKPNKYGMDVFPFKVSDSAPSPVISSANVTIEVTDQNDPPVFNKPSGLISVFQGQTNDINLNSYVSDVDTTATKPTVFTYSLPNGSTTTNGATLNVVANTGIYSYQAPMNYIGTDSFDVQVSDGSAMSNITTIDVDVVSASSGVPIATNLPNLETDEDILYVGKLIATAPNNGVITQYNITKEPSSGNVVLIDSSTGDYQYIPAQDFNGTDNFEYNAVDNTNAQSAPAKVSITINPVNDPPSVDTALSDLFVEVAAADQVEVLGKKIIATDVDSTQLVYSVSVQPRNGSVMIDSSTGIYDYIGTNKQHEGEDSFTVTVSDNNLSIDQQVTVCTYINNTTCDTLTKPILVSPAHGATDVALTADFEWKQSKLKNNTQGDISYRIIICNNSAFIGCDFVNIPKDVVNKANNKQISALSIGGTTILVIGLIGGGLTQRRQRKLRNILIAVIVLISACNSALEESIPSPNASADISGTIVYSVSGLQSNTSYFWKVISTDETTQKSAQSATQSFLTVP